MIEKSSSRVSAPWTSRAKRSSSSSSDFPSGTARASASSKAFELQHASVGSADLVDAVAEEEQPGRRDEGAFLSVVASVRQHPQGQPSAGNGLALPRSAARTAHQDRRRMAGARVAQAASGSMIDAVPDGEVQIVVMFHLVSLVQRAQHFLRQDESRCPAKRPSAEYWSRRPTAARRRRHDRRHPGGRARSARNRSSGSRRSLRRVRCEGT